MFYTDMHSHILFGVDDGAQTEQEMYALLDASYADGVRTLCLTPHYQPTYYGENKERAAKAFRLLCDYAGKKYPDITLHLACELGYYTDCCRALDRGELPLLGGKYVLLDFLPDVSLFTMRYAVDDLTSAGHRVLLAHIERYECLYGKEDILWEWETRGVRFQANASSFLNDADRKTKKQIKRLMKQAFIHAVASDTHDFLARPSRMRAAEQAITDRFGKDTAEFLLVKFPSRILAGQSV